MKTCYLIDKYEKLMNDWTIVEFNQIPATVASVVAAKKRGRPPGAKNKPKSPSSVNYLTKKNSPNTGGSLIKLYTQC